MDDDQQFCLRWNNHQSTLVAVFDTLLENGTLVDCTLAAEGKCLNAHKVVLSACSPYFQALLSKHFDKHPILILKDVKFQELKAMMDYMYRGEVNISQDQLGALLKAAESLQIKGLSDNKKGENERKHTPAAPPPKSPQPASTLPKVQGLTIEQRAREDSREGSMSPGPRKKKRLRRKSEELDNHDASNSSESHSLPAQSIPLPTVTKMNADVPEQVETKSEILTRHKQTDDMPQVPILKEKIETHTELMLEPKSEYVEEMNEDSIEDLTLDDDDISNMEQVDDQAGPSHGAGEGSSQGFGGWHMGNQSQDEVFLAAQEAVGAHRDSQEHGSSHGHSHGRLSHSRNRLTQLAITDDNENDETYPSPPVLPNPSIEKVVTHSHSSGQMNMRGVFLHVLSDALGSVIVMISALVFWLTDWTYKYYIDPALSILLVLLILNSVWPLLRDSALILLQTVPTHIQVDAIQNRLLAKVDGVLAVHEFHVWQLAGDRIIASAHIRCRNLSEYMKIAERVKEFFHNEGIHSTTIQPEFIDYTDIPTTSTTLEPMTEDCVLDCPRGDNSNDNCVKNTCCGPSKQGRETPSPNNTPYICRQRTSAANSMSGHEEMNEMEKGILLETTPALQTDCDCTLRGSQCTFRG